MALSAGESPGNFPKKPLVARNNKNALGQSCTYIYIQINGALLVHHVYQPKISLVCHFQPFTTRNVASLLVAERKLCVHHKICDRITKNDFPARTNYEPVENWMAANGLCDPSKFRVSSKSGFLVLGLATCNNNEIYRIEHTQNTTIKRCSHALRNGFTFRHHMHSFVASLKNDTRGRTGSIALGTTSATTLAAQHKYQVLKSSIYSWWWQSLLFGNTIINRCGYVNIYESNPPIILYLIGGESHYVPHSYWLNYDAVSFWSWNKIWSWSWSVKRCFSRDVQSSKHVRIRTAPKKFGIVFAIRRKWLWDANAIF